MKRFMLSESKYHEFHLSSSNVEEHSYIIQLQYTICDGIKATRDNNIFTGIFHVPALIEQLQKKYDEYKKKQILDQQNTNIIIDE